MNKIRLINGDCLIGLDKLFSEKIKVDAVIADIPYGVTAAKWDSVIPFDLMWNFIDKVSKENAATVLFGVEPFSSKLRLSNLQNFKYDWIWHKNTTSGFALAKKQPLRNHEIISVFYEKQCTYNYIKEPRDLSESSQKRFQYAFNTEKGLNVLQKGLKKIKYIPEDKNLSYPKTVKYFKTLGNNSKDKIHPTQKPLDLIEYLVKTYTDKDQTVLDFTAGSFTTAIACINTQRSFIGIELDKTYFDKGLSRVQNSLLDSFVLEY
jgi:site-specific DNA-methyltransferase (adenine-specific)